jgi:hypothetical protein
MSKWSFAVETITLTGVLDTANFTDSGYMGLTGPLANTTQRRDIYEVYMGGLAGASSPTPAVLGFDSTIGATFTALTTAQSNSPLDTASAAFAAPQVAFVATTTKPQRAATLAKLVLAFNAFGGIVRWVASPGSEMKCIGAAANLGEVSLSAYTGGTPGLMMAHILYEMF